MTLWPRSTKSDPPDRRDEASDLRPAEGIDMIGSEHIEVVQPSKWVVEHVAIRRLCNGCLAVGLKRFLDVLGLVYKSRTNESRLLEYFRFSRLKTWTVFRPWSRLSTHVAVRSGGSKVVWHFSATIARRAQNRAGNRAPTCGARRRA